MNRDEMEGFLKRVFENVSAGSDVDLDKLRKEIGKINGIGTKRLDEIMAIIEKTAIADANRS